jgi:membrane-associated phospholipid phosphatase
LTGTVLVFRPGSFLLRAALAATSLLFLGSPAGWVPLVLLPALAWSRLALKRHTPAEVATGLLIGIASGYAIINA